MVLVMVLVLALAAVETAQAWELASLGRCLNNRTVNLFAMSLDNCVRFDTYSYTYSYSYTYTYTNDEMGASSMYPGMEVPLSVEDLECLNGYNEFRSCASCYLCHYYLHYGQDVDAYKYALRSLELSPASAPALDCLASVYWKQGSLVRTAFYTSLSNHHNNSLRIHHDFFGNNDTVFQHMKTHHHDILFPDYSGVLAFLSRVDKNDMAIIDTYEMLFGILLELNGSVSIYHAYIAHVDDLPRRMIGPSVFAYEEFLSHFENLLRWYADEYLRFTGEVLGDNIIGVASGGTSEFDLLVEDVPLIQWPQDKTVVMLVQPKFVGHTMTFDDNIHGMSDALVRLGVPFRIVTRLIPDDDFVSLQHFGVEKNELMDKNFIHWNFEKNPRLAKHLEQPGMLFDDCGNDNAVFSADYIKKSAMIWETVPFNLLTWDDISAAKLQLVPSPLPDELILRTRAEQCFAEKFAKFTEQGYFYKYDFNRRIDILFYGNSNEHRESVFVQFANMAKVHGLRVEFKMGYNLFGSQRDSLIDQAKIVLNLANHAWPRNSTSSCAAAANSHRIRSLLARGKVILSESTGSSIEEELYAGVVVFASTADLVKTAIELLRSPQVRWDLERRVGRFIGADHFSTVVPTFAGNQLSKNTESLSRLSTLSLVANALQSAAGALWPDRVTHEETSSNHRRSVTYTELMQQRIERVEILYRSHLDRKNTFVSRESYSYLWAELRCWHSKQLLDELLYHDTLSTIMFNSIGSRNGSSLCDQRVDLEVLSGYLTRRYTFYNNSKKILLVGCEDKVSAKIKSSFIQSFPEIDPTVQLDFRCMNPEQFRKSQQVSFFDQIIINQALLKSSFSSLKPIFNHALKSLNREQGSCVFVNGMLPAVENTRVDGNWLNADSYELIISMRSLNNFDAALGNFEGGLLIVTPRQNPYRISQENLAQLKFSYTEFRKNVDKIIPILSFSEIHDWFTYSTYTKRFARNLQERNS